MIGAEFNALQSGSNGITKYDFYEKLRAYKSSKYQNLLFFFGLAESLIDISSSTEGPRNKRKTVFDRYFYEK